MEILIFFLYLYHYHNGGGGGIADIAITKLEFPDTINFFFPCEYFIDVCNFSSFAYGLLLAKSTKYN